MSEQDPKRPSSLMPDEEAHIDSLFDKLTDASLRPPDPSQAAADAGATLTPAATPEPVQAITITAGNSSLPPPPAAASKSSVPPSPAGATKDRKSVV
jgi:hypothetical protein